MWYNLNWRVKYNVLINIIANEKHFDNPGNEWTNISTLCEGVLRNGKTKEKAKVVEKRGLLIENEWVSIQEVGWMREGF